MRKSTKQRRTRLFLIVFLCVALPLAALVFLWLVTLPDVASLRSTNPTSTALIEAREAEAKEKGSAIGRIGYGSRFLASLPICATQSWQPKIHRFSRMNYSIGKV